jgi:hypothetical protein
MKSEAARRDTFASWSHREYKWKLTAQMGDAGFSHQPNTLESDRAVCFLCNMCLICLEQSDDPWSEHERHAASCPLVKGDLPAMFPLLLRWLHNRLSNSTKLSIAYRLLLVQIFLPLRPPMDRLFPCGTLTVPSR